MAEHTGIAWTRSTWNPWIGCSKIGPGCDLCYAEALDKRHRFGGDTHWGDDKPRHRTSLHYWNDPIRWNKAAGIEKEIGVVAKGNWHTPGFWPVFCASLADVFDNQVPQEWRSGANGLWQLITDTPYLEWLLVTKRIGNVSRMIPSLWDQDGWPDNVRLLITVCNQEEADRDIPKLLALNCKNGISYEPALGPVDWRPHLAPQYRDATGPKRAIEWLIVGGESTQDSGKARPFDIQLAYSTIEQCKAAGVPIFVKQLGSHPCLKPGGNFFSPDFEFGLTLKDPAGADPAEWPADLQIQEFPA